MPYPKHKPSPESKSRYQYLTPFADGALRVHKAAEIAEIIALIDGSSKYAV
jgi:hypothetical protein